MLGIEVVDHDQVEVGGRRHLAPAELAEREDRHLLPGDAAVQAGELLLDGAVQRADQHIREPREGLARLLRRHGARQDARADQEHVLLREDANAIEKVLVRSGLAQRALEPGGKLGFLGQRAEEARIDHRIHGFRKLREAVGQPRRGAEHQRDQRDQIGILPQQRKQAGRRRAARQGSGRRR